MDLSENYFNTVDRRQPKRSDDSISKAHIECLATDNSVAEPPGTGLRFSPGTVHAITSITFFLLYTQTTASHL